MRSEYKLSVFINCPVGSGVPEISSRDHIYGPRLRLYRSQRSGDKQGRGAAEQDLQDHFRMPDWNSRYLTNGVGSENKTPAIQHAAGTWNVFRSKGIRKRKTKG